MNNSDMLPVHTPYLPFEEDELDPLTEEARSHSRVSRDRSDLGGSSIDLNTINDNDIHGMYGTGRQSSEYRQTWQIWMNVYDWDDFVTLMYKYYVEGGRRTILLTESLRIL